MSRELVLSFHGIGVPPPFVPEAEQPYWIRENDFATFIASAATQAQELAITLVASFDDGNRSDRDVAAPLLKRHRIRGVFFPCTGRIGHPRYLGVEDIRALEREGFEIGSHGIEHVPWTGLDGEALERETVGSKTALQEILGRDVRSAALPFGAYNRRVLAALRAAGYGTVYSSDTGLSQAGQWFRQRWTYRAEMPFEIGQLAAISIAFRHRLFTASKNLIKSLR